MSALPKELRAHTALLVYGSADEVERYRAHARAPCASVVLSEPLESNTLLDSVRRVAHGQPTVRARLPSDTLALADASPKNPGDSSGAGDDVRRQTPWADPGGLCACLPDANGGHRYSRFV